MGRRSVYNDSSSVMIANTANASFFFFNDTATTEIYTLSLHDALPIYNECLRRWVPSGRAGDDHRLPVARPLDRIDRKSTRLNSSHTVISYAVFCLKKKTALSNARAYAKFRVLLTRRIMP